MRFSRLFSDRRVQVSVVILVFLISGFTAMTLQEIRSSNIEDRIITSEDCDVPEKFDIEFGDLDYYPENETARLELNSTENVTSDNLENVSLQGFKDKGPDRVSPVIKTGNRTSRSGLIATVEDSKKTVGDFPIQPMNITIKGMVYESGNFSGLEPGDQIQLRYHKQYVAVQNFCRHTQDIALFKLREDGLDIEWR